MSKTKRIDSTENLLELIRGGDDPSAEASAPPPPPAVSRPRRRRRSRAWISFSRQVVVGVDITFRSIRMVKAVRGDARRRILGYAEFAVDLKRNMNTPEFPEFLAECLDSFAGRDRKPLIWAMLRVVELDVSRVLVPRVGASKVPETVYWKLKNEKKFQDDEVVVDVRAQGPETEKGVPKTAALACIAHREPVHKLSKWFEDAGYPLDGICPLPTAVAGVYASGLFPEEPTLYANLHMDSSFSTISLFEGDKLMFSRTIKTGANSMADGLRESFNQGIRGEEEAEMGVHQANAVLACKLLDHPLDQDMPCAKMPDDQLFDALEPALQRLTRQVERTLDYYQQYHGQRCEIMHFSGDLMTNERLREVIAGSLGVRQKLFDPMGPRGTSDPGHGPDDQADRVAFNLAVSAALSDPDRAINLHFNYAKRARQALWNRLSDGLAVAAIVLFCCLAGVFAWQRLVVHEQQMELVQMHREYEAIEPKIDEGDLALLASDIAGRQDTLREVVRRYEPLAVLAELGRLAPTQVRLLNLDMSLGGMRRVSSAQEGPAQDAAATGMAEQVQAAAQSVIGGQGQPAAAPGQPGQAAVTTIEPRARYVILDGVVVGDPLDFTQALSEFMVNLESSPVFSSPTLHNSQMETLSGEGEVLHFTLHLGLS